MFEENGSYQVRYDLLLQDDNWSKSDPVSFGTDLYWIRIRIENAINATPVIEQFKLHTNRTELNADGFIEYFGKGRPIGKLPWIAQQIAPTSLGNLADGDVYFSDNIALGGRENVFGNGDNAGFSSSMPNDFDTSTPVGFTMVFRAATTGTTAYTIRWTYAEPGTNAYSNTTGAPTPPLSDPRVNTISGNPSPSISFAVSNPYTRIPSGTIAVMSDLVITVSAE